MPKILFTPKLCEVSWGDYPNFPACNNKPIVKVKDSDGSSFYICDKHLAYVKSRISIRNTWRVVQELGNAGIPNQKAEETVSK